MITDRYLAGMDIEAGGSIMARTALGLFENQAMAAQVAQEIMALGCATEEVRVLFEPLDMPVTTVMSTPGMDFSMAYAENFVGSEQLRLRQRLTCKACETEVPLFLQLVPVPKWIAQ
jgi:hypothetical protein